MIDTIVLTLKMGMFTILDHDKFSPSTKGFMTLRLAIIAWVVGLISLVSKTQRLTNLKEVSINQD